MNKYWKDILEVLDALAPQYYIEKMILTEQDIINSPIPVRIGDIVLIPNPNYKFEPRV